MMLSNGIEITWKVPESEKSKKLQGLLSKKAKGPNQLVGTDRRLN